MREWYKNINKVVKRHINRFSKRFMFQLTKEELKEISKDVKQLQETFDKLEEPEVKKILLNKICKLEEKND